MNLPRYVLKGQAITADQFNKLIDVCRGLRLNAGPGIRVNQTTSGTTVAVKPTVAQAAGGAPTEFTHPFKITDASDDDGAKVKCQFGTVNSIDITLEDGTTELVDNPDIELADIGTWSIFIALAVVDDETIAQPGDDYCWVVKASDGLPADTELLGYILLAQVDVAAGVGDDPPNVVSAIRQAVTHSLRHTICGRVASDDGADPPVAFVAGQHQFWGV